MTWSRSACVLIALAGLTAGAPAVRPSAAPLPWCASLPLPQSARTPSCRALEVRTPSTTLHLAVAATEPQRAHGLMGVASVPARQGMIFAFDGVDDRRYFWMKDTIAALDMVFVGSDGTISSVAPNVPATKPGTPDDQLARRDGIGRYVIELGAGEAARLGLVAGVRLIVPAVEVR